MISAHDILDAVIRYTGAQSSEQIVTDAKESILDALAELWSKYDWPWYQDQHIMQFDPPYSTGTVQYDATTRQFTLTGGTWPSWAIYGVMKIGNNDARVNKRISDTVLEIEDGSGYLTDLTTDTAYTLYRHAYPVPSTIRKVSYLFLDQQKWQSVVYLPAIEFRTCRPGSYGAVPQVFTIMKDRAVGTGLALYLWPYPGTRYTARFNYIRSPEPITIWNESTGKITVTSGDATVTGTDTAFTTEHEGCLLRVGRTASAVPTAVSGTAPLSEELLIDTVASATSLEATSEVTTSRTAVKYDISSILDIDEIIMRPVFMQHCYYQMGKRRSYDDKKMAIIAKTLLMDLANAKSSAAPSKEIEYAGNPRAIRGYAGYSGSWYPVGYL